MDATTGAAQAAQAKDEFFAARMYVFHITGFPQQPSVLLSQVDAPHGARLDVWPTDPAEDRQIPSPDAEGILFSTPRFSLVNSGNRTLHAPKRSWKITLERAAGSGNHLAGMARVNLKSMYNDASQMREALAWALFRRAGVPAARHTYARLAINGAYQGLYSLIEQVDKRFLKDHFGGNDRGNLYKAYCGDVGCATLEHRTGADGNDSGRQYFTKHDDPDLTYRLKTNEDDPDLNSYDDLAQFIRVINGIGLPGDDRRFDTDAFRESVEGILNVRAFLRWAGLNVLLGSWDNYFATPANYYLYNSGRRGSAKRFMNQPYFTFLPWDYDNSLGIDYTGTRWQDTNLLDWPANTEAYNKHRGRSRIPLVQNLLANHDLAQYYLDHVEHLLDTDFTPAAISARMGVPDGSGLWQRIIPSAYFE